MDGCAFLLSGAFVCAYVYRYVCVIQRLILLGESQTLFLISQVIRAYSTPALVWFPVSAVIFFFLNTVLNLCYKKLIAFNSPHARRLCFCLFS